ncbi:retrovirus-related pol polyprotein from transposon TNT 1-94 [Tanacetum coccineum]|uniref:Retrovirus-related pol polyprotein from transposon TNT 1-94 n=1 Tax=Tanacetum coccineum TaxID=301880 RepID=A0ABQ4YNS1_9ASTR
MNNLKEDFSKHFVTQQELSAEQAFWLKHSNYNPDTSVKSHTPVRIEAPSELPKCSVDKNAFEIQIKQLHIDNDQLLNQIMSQEILNIAVNSVDILDISKSCVNECSKCLELETELLKKKILIEKDVYDKLFKSYSTLEKHCISLELATQLNQEIFQKDNSVKNDIDEIKTINIELEHSVAKSLSENENLRKEREHLKSICKDQFDSIKKTRVRSKEHFDSLIAQINAKSVENLNLNAQLRENVFAIAALKNELRKLKGKNFVDTAVSTPIVTIISPGMFKINLEPLAPKLLKNKDAHIDYIKHSRDHADTLREIVKNARVLSPLDNNLDSTCKYVQRIQEVLVYVKDKCPCLSKPSEKLVAVTLMNKDKKVRFAEPVTSSSNIPKQIDSLKTQDSNKPLLPSTGVNTTTSASGSKPSGNTKKNRITRPPSKSKKHSYKPKAEDSIQEKLCMLHMDLCGPMRIQSINGRKYILVIVDDYSRFTWVKFLRSKDEVPEFVIKFLKMIQVRLNATVRNIRTDNGTEFVNQTLRAYYEEVGISHQTSVARTPQQNGVVKRRNRTLVEAARTMLIFSKALLFLWAEAVATACYTQNRSLIQKRHNKTPYELLHDRKPDLSYLHVFGALCYPTNDGEDLGKLKPKADIGIFVGYAPAKKAFQIYNKRTRKIIETIHVNFDELTAMASEQFSSGPGTQLLPHETISLGLVQNIPSPTPYVPPTKNDWDTLFQPMFDEYLNHPPS